MVSKLLAGFALPCVMICAPALAQTPNSALPPAASSSPADILGCSQATGVAGHWMSKACTALQLTRAAPGANDPTDLVSYWGVDNTGATDASQTVAAAIAALRSATPPRSSAHFRGELTFKELVGIPAGFTLEGEGHPGQSTANSPSWINCSTGGANCVAETGSGALLRHVLLDGGVGQMTGTACLLSEDGGSGSSIYNVGTQDVVMNNGVCALYEHNLLHVRHDDTIIGSSTATGNAASFSGATFGSDCVYYVDGRDGTSVQDVSWKSGSANSKGSQGAYGTGVASAVCLDGWDKSFHFYDFAENFGGNAGIALLNTAGVTECPGFIEIDGGRGQEDGFGSDLDAQCYQDLLTLTNVYLKQGGPRANLFFGLGNNAPVIITGIEDRGAGREAIRTYSPNIFVTGSVLANNATYNNPAYALPVTAVSAMPPGTVSATFSGDAMTLAAAPSSGSVTPGQSISATGLYAGTLVESLVSGMANTAGSVYRMNLVAQTTEATAETATLGGNAELTYNPTALAASYNWQPLNRDLVIVSSTGAADTTTPLMLEPVDSTHVALALTPTSTGTVAGTMQLDSPQVRLMSEVSGTNGFTMAGAVAGASPDGLNRATFGIVADPGVTNARATGVNECGNTLGPALNGSTDPNTSIGGSSNTCSASPGGALVGTLTGTLTASSTTFYNFSNKLQAALGERFVIKSVTVSTTTGTASVGFVLAGMGVGSALSATTTSTTFNLTSPIEVDATTATKAVQFRLTAASGTGLTVQFNYWKQ